MGGANSAGEREEPLEQLPCFTVLIDLWKSVTMRHLSDHSQSATFYMPRIASWRQPEHL